MKLILRCLLFSAALVIDAVGAAASSRPNIVILYADDLIANKTGAHTRVPVWVIQENGYPKNEYDGELYDLGRDPGQKKNLYASRPDKVKELSHLLAHVREKGQVR